MSAVLPGQIPWRVKLKTRGSTWFSPGLTELDAIQLTLAIADQLHDIRDGAGMLAFATRYGVDAMVRARDVVSVEPVGPRWDDEDDNGRAARVPETPDDAPVAAVHRLPSDADDGTAWLRTRERQAASRKGGRP